MTRDEGQEFVGERSALPDDPIAQLTQAAARLAHLAETLRTQSLAVEGLVHGAGEQPVPRDEFARVVRPSLDTLGRIGEEMEGALVTLRSLGEAWSRREVA